MHQKVAKIVEVEFPHDPVLTVLRITSLRDRDEVTAIQNLGGRRYGSERAAERWGCLVLKGCDAVADLPTISAWATAIASSYSALAEACRIIGVPPHEARDFMRVLRVLCRTREVVGHVEAELLVADKRTLRRLLQRSGVGTRLQNGGEPFSIDEFFLAQQFIEKDHPSLVAIRNLTADLL